MTNISVLILTKNEEIDISDCLASVSWSDNVCVLDSYSTDRTVELAEVFGASVYLREFRGYAAQRNFGLNIEFKNDWILILDADERISEAGAAEMMSFVSSASEDCAAGRLRRRDFWGTQWLKNSQISPYFVRLVRKGRAHYEREINEVIVVDGRVQDLTIPFDHFPFSKGLKHWIEKHNSYSTMEAALIVGGASGDYSWRSALFHSDFNERRKHQKRLFYKLPFRPIVKFVYMLVFRRAVFDGIYGVRYAILQAIYEYFIVIKVKEKIK